MAPINVTTSSSKITAAVSEDKVTANVTTASPISATVTAGFGATGPAGVVNVTAPITNAGTTTAANVGLAVGDGLSVAGGSLRVTPGTYATLVGGKVPADQLPSYVDDVLEFASVGVLPTPGETGKIYIALNTGKIYRWSGSAYFEISTPPDNTDAVPEGASNLYFTNARARNAFGTGTNGQVITWSGGDWTAGTPSTYSLPTASASVLGGVKIGSGVTIADGVISVSVPSLDWANITGIPGTFAPEAHAASHAAGGADELFDQNLGTEDAPTFAGLSLPYFSATDYAAGANGVRFEWDEGLFLGPAPSGTGTSNYAIGSFGNPAVDDRHIDLQTGGFVGPWDFASATVAGLSYDDLDDLPTLFSGSYNDLTDLPPTYTRLSDTVSNVSYLGLAPAGSATSASAWRIKRTTIAADGTVSASVTATNVAWNDRLTASYS